MKLSVLLFVVLALSQTVTSQEWCPTGCDCLILAGNRPRNHATCSSVQGLLDGKDVPLHSLDLSHANLSKAPHLVKLRVLSSVDLSYNHLSTIDHLGRRIKSLNLKHNKITSAKLANIPRHVENLDLSYNEITYLPLELTKLQNLKKIELIGNKINCTCETIQVRNWLQSHNVWTDNHIKCSYPAKVKDLPWLRVKQAEICQSSEDEFENNIMFADQPILNEGSAEKESNEELGKDFLIVRHTTPTPKVNDNSEVVDDDGEGSGDGPKMAQLMLKLDSGNETETDDDGSSSGFGPLIIPDIMLDSNEDDENNGTSILFGPDMKTSEETDPLSAPYDEATSSSPELVGPVLLTDTDLNTEKQEDLQEVMEEEIVPTILRDTQSGLEKDNRDFELVSSDPHNANIKIGNDVKQADSGENQGTYILLGVIALIVISLIVFVAFKRVRSGRKTRSDPENPRGTELSDMDRKNLGKPKQKPANGNYENKPLIAEKAKEDLAKPINASNRKFNTETDSNTREPLLNGSSKDPAAKNQNTPQSESNNNVPPPDSKPNDSNTIPTTPPKSPSTYSPKYGGYPPPKSPRPPKPDNVVNDDEVFLPSSPRQGRYSPVYSPETGKVKIKLTETPKLKTPQVVTRGRSNAGEQQQQTQPSKSDAEENNQ